MQKVVFCNVIYMNRYQGINDKDKPRSVSGYANEVDSANQCYNFMPNNHICYGYFDNNNQNLDIEKVANVPASVQVIHDVTVIWTAANEQGRKIVGWYEHADMYRSCQIFADDTLGDENHANWKYYFETNEQYAYIIPEKERSFSVSFNNNIQYNADNASQVLSYLNSIRKKCINPAISEDILNKRAPQSPLHSKALFEKACELSDNGSNIKAIQIFNLLESQVKEQIDLCRIKFMHGWALNRLLLYDEAIDVYKKVLNMMKQFDIDEIKVLQLDCMWQLAWLYQRTQQYPSAWQMYDQLFKAELELGDKLNALFHLMYIATQEKNWNGLKSVINVYDKLNTKEMANDVNEYRKILQRAQKQ